MRRGWRASSPVLAERCVPALSWLLPGMGPPGGRWLRPNLRAPRAEVLSGGTRASEHLVLRLVRFRLPSVRHAGRHHSVHRSRVACVNPARLVALLATRRPPRGLPEPAAWLGNFNPPWSGTRRSRPCSGPALLPGTVSPASGATCLAPPGAVYDDLGTVPACPLPDHEPSHRRRYGPRAEVQNVTFSAAHSGAAGRGTCRSTGRACW